MIQEETRKRKFLRKFQRWGGGGAEIREVGTGVTGERCGKKKLVL